MQGDVHTTYITLCIDFTQHVNKKDILKYLLSVKYYVLFTNAFYNVAYIYLYNYILRILFNHTKILGKSSKCLLNLGTIKLSFMQKNNSQYFTRNHTFREFSQETANFHKNKKECKLSNKGCHT